MTSTTPIPTNIEEGLDAGQPPLSSLGTEKHVELMFDGSNELQGTVSMSSSSSFLTKEESYSRGNEEEEGSPEDKEASGATPTGTTSTPVDPSSTTLLFSETFFCPLSGNLLVDPVVAPDGISYSRAALNERVGIVPGGNGEDGTNINNGGGYCFDSDIVSKVYENRSLKTIIDEAIKYNNSSGLERLSLNLRHISQQLLAIPYHCPLPEGFYCPITLSLIHVPVIDPEGYSYEKNAIENWIRTNGASPVTRRPMSISELYPNKTLAMLIAEETSRSDDVMHPTFHQWKKEKGGPPPSNIGTTTSDVEEGQIQPSTSTNHTLQPTLLLIVPSTPEELEAAHRQLERRRFIHATVALFVVVGLIILSFKVPFMSTVIYLGLVIHCGCSNRIL